MARAWTRRAPTRWASTPIKPLLAEIDAMKTAADVQRDDRDVPCSWQSPSRSGCYGGPDNHEPTQTSSPTSRQRAGHARPRLLLQARAAVQEAREKYRAHVAKMFTLAGVERGRRKGGRRRPSSRSRRGSPRLARQRRAARPDRRPITRRTFAAAAEARRRTSTGPPTSTRRGLADGRRSTSTSRSS